MFLLDSSLPRRTISSRLFHLAPSSSSPSSPPGLQPKRWAGLCEGSEAGRRSGEEDWDTEVVGSSLGEERPGEGTMRGEGEGGELTRVPVPLGEGGGVGRTRAVGGPRKLGRNM